MKTIFHASSTRGSANHGWLNAKHSFSFANWYDPEKMHFGALRVLNDDIVSKGAGFGKHPHDNMEIITIPLSGSLKHQDSMGNSSVINAGEIQVMSAGSGIQHSEFNPSHSEDLNLFQIWILPNQRNVVPRYDQFVIDTVQMKNNFLQLVSPNKGDAGTWIYQQAWIHMAEIDENKEITYTVHSENNGVYFMVIEGEFQIDQQKLEKRDALGIWDTNNISIKANQSGRILAIEVPMN